MISAETIHDPQTLSDSQLGTLLNILFHDEVYREIEAFKKAKAIQEYGGPFQPGARSTTPVLQALFAGFALSLPGLNNVQSTFWTDRVLPLISDLSDANLSESYDKGILGQRKTVSSAISALLEYPAHGYFRGLEERPPQSGSGTYEVSDPDDLEKAWHDFLQRLVYGDLINDVFAKAAQTDQLDEHTPLIQAAHRYIVLNLASFLHYTIVVSPKGPALLALLESTHKLVPYGIVRQTLRVGNAATMINGMIRVVLAKASVATVTNWLGISQEADEGMNLLQTIISMVLQWDVKRLRTRITQIEKAKDVPSMEQRIALEDYVKKTQEEQEMLRAQSKSTSRSIVAVILSSGSSVSSTMLSSTHALALEYLSLLFSVRDRERLISVLCQRNPDLVTPIARDLVLAYDPIIRAIHNSVNLSAVLLDTEAFINDLIKISKPASEKKQAASVGDFVELLEKHQTSSHRFVHQVAKHAKEVTKWYQEYAVSCAANFRRHKSHDVSPAQHMLGEELRRAVDSLNPTDRHKVINDLDRYDSYFSSLSKSSSQRAKTVLSSGSSTHYGPGLFLAQWQAILDATEITPAEEDGPVRRGVNADVKEAARVDVDGEKKGDEAAEDEAAKQTVAAPDMSAIVSLLGKKFWEILRGE